MCIFSNKGILNHIQKCDIVVLFVSCFGVDFCAVCTYSVLFHICTCNVE